MNIPVEQVDFETPRDDDLFAAEYVLGVLDADDRRTAQARIAREPGFSALVGDWEARFAEWLLRVVPLNPGEQVWPRIRTSLGWAPVGADSHPRADGARGWKVATALAAAAAIAAISFAFLQQRPVQVQPPTIVVNPTAPLLKRPVTVLERDDGHAGWVASFDANTQKLHMAPVPVPADVQGRVNELWIIPAGQAPISLGLLSAETTQVIDVPAALRSQIRAGATLAVTLEPKLGIPHAAPTGPIVAKGSITQI